jgi:ADP-ribosylglycohydrolase
MHTDALLQAAALDRARLSLEGLSVGDAFGEQVARTGLEDRMKPTGAPPQLTPERWTWTDDTAMALSIVEILERHAGIDEESLARAFAARYDRDSGRGYGRGAHRVLDAIHHGMPYGPAARLLFGGEGSKGNGGGMRSAPIGAYFAGDLASTIEHARRSAAPTHAHPDGVAGAVAIAVVACQVFAGERDPRALLDAAVAHTPPGATREGLRRAIALLGAEPATAAAELGNGSHVISADTIPFAAWCAASHLDDYAAGLWACGIVGGDVDTTCAMVGGIVVGAVGSAGIPARWREAREPLFRA